MNNTGDCLLWMGSACFASLGQKARSMLHHLGFPPSKGTEDDLHDSLLRVLTMMNIILKGSSQCPNPILTGVITDQLLLRKSTLSAPLDAAPMVPMDW